VEARAITLTYGLSRSLEIWCVHFPPDPLGETELERGCALELSLSGVWTPTVSAG